MKAGSSPYRALLESLQLTQDSMKIQLINEANKVSGKSGLRGLELVRQVLATESDPEGQLESDSDQWG